MPITGDIEKQAREAVRRLIKLRDVTLPRKAGIIAQRNFRDNFRRGGFSGTRWQEPLRRSLGFSGASGSYGPLTSGTDTLMNSIDYRTQPGKAIVFTDLVYAGVHNEGADITVTPRMKGFFRYKLVESTRDKGKGSPEADFWLRMAIKPAGTRIHIPKRQFMGDSPQLSADLSKMINNELKKLIDGITDFRPH